MNQTSQPYIRKRRYSNATVDLGLFTQLPGSDDYSSVGASGAGFNPSSLIEKGLGTVENIVTSLWGKGDKYRVQALQYLNEEQKKTTYILWAIIGIVLVLAVILVFKKK